MKFSGVRVSDRDFTAVVEAFRPDSASSEVLVIVGLFSLYYLLSLFGAPRSLHGCRFHQLKKTGESNQLH